MEPKLTRIVAAVVDEHRMTLYKESGEKVYIPQGDPRLRKIVEEHGAHLEQHKWADVDLSEEVENHYAEFEAMTNGVVKFYRVAKAKLKQLIGLGLIEEEPFDDAVAATSIGSVPTTTAAVAGAPLQPASDTQEEEFKPVAPSEPVKKSHTMAAVDEIIKNAVPASSPEFHERDIEQARPIAEGGITTNAHPEDKAQDTIIAVVGGKVIPNMERIKPQFARAAKMGSPEGVERFLQRLSTVIEQRSHSVDDLLKFMERADLPIADDGSILIYKVLRRRGNKEYVDCHSGNVKQFIGAYVCMDESLVDHNRNNECSNGLHVARRGYIRCFSGDVCVLAKLAPEDVITVPAYDANKMRVCGYHILFELSDAQYSLVKQNRPMTEDPEGKVLLARAMRGDHIHKTHEVRIRGQMGSNVETKALNRDTGPVLAPKPSKEEIGQEEALLDSQKESDLPINPANIDKTMEQAMSRKQQAQQMYDAWASQTNPERKAELLADLLAFKKAAKVGWDRLGILDPQATKSPQQMPVKQKETIKSAAPKQTAVRISKELAEANIGSPRERIAKLLAIGLDKKMAERIFEIKKAAKKSWENLGLSDKQIKQILKLLDGK